MCVVATITNILLSFTRVRRSLLAHFYTSAWQYELTGWLTVEEQTLTPPRCHDTIHAVNHS